MNKSYIQIIDEVELNYLVHQLKEGKLSHKALSQRIYRAKTEQEMLTMKVALCVVQVEGKF